MNTKNIKRRKNGFNPVLGLIPRLPFNTNNTLILIIRMIIDVCLVYLYKELAKPECLKIIHNLVNEKEAEFSNFIIQVFIISYHNIRVLNLPNFWSSLREEKYVVRLGYRSIFINFEFP